ncbi:hypothetical protein M9Y10_011289 [Tritrichomonas musculus]|uniref:Uncharacterized protein n=1 Tax=Tritrichomonas musculus TaxID=1915356 RepID=A0ABR2IJ44_9EUKA
MTTAAPILIQDLPVYISSKTGEPVTISKSDFFSLFDHSLFLNEKGAIYACGNNRSGQLFFSKLEMDDCGIKPTKTPVKSGATFCIADNAISVAFLYSQPPPSTPNQKYESDFIESQYSENGNDEEEEAQESDQQDSEDNDNENSRSEDNDNEDLDNDGSDKENLDNENNSSDDADDDKTIDFDASYKMQLKSVHEEIDQIAECVSKHNDAIN